MPLCTALAGLPLLVETPSRQAEIALFTFYKCMEIAYNLGRRRGMRVRVPWGNCTITGSALCLICFHYWNNRGAIKESYLALIDKLLADC